MEKNAVNVKTMTPAVLEELEDLRSRMAKRTVELFTDRGRASGMKRDHRFRALRGVVFRPQIAIAETDKHIEVRAALPGFESEEVTVFVEPQTITINGKRKNDTHIENQDVEYPDFSTGEVFRRFQLPAEADPDGARAALKDGILSLTLPKAGTSEKKEVNAEGPSAA
jgi:HSP20 family protein